MDLANTTICLPTDSYIYKFRLVQLLFSPESFPGFGQIGREFCSDPIILFRRVSAAVVPVYVLLYTGPAVQVCVTGKRKRR